MKQILLVLLFISGAATATALADLCSAPFDGDAWKTVTPDSIACVDVNARIASGHASGQTPLHYAAKYSQNPEVISALIERGADINATDKHGETPLHLAAAHNENTKVISLLIEQGANINATDKIGKTPFHEASYNKNPEVEKVIFDICYKRSKPEAPQCVGWWKSPHWKLPRLPSEYLSKKLKQHYNKAQFRKGR